jgi:hypothetical protein
VFDEGVVLSTLTEKDFSRTYELAPVAIECLPPQDYYKYAIIGIKNWIRTSDAITAEVFLTSVVPAKNSFRSPFFLKPIIEVQRY